jgi:hypothetical protein
MRNLIGAAVLGSAITVALAASVWWSLPTHAKQQFSAHAIGMTTTATNFCSVPELAKLKLLSQTTATNFCSVPELAKLKLLSQTTATNFCPVPELAKLKLLSLG